MPWLLQILKSLLTKKNTSCTGFSQQTSTRNPWNIPPNIPHTSKNEGWTLYLRGDFSVQWYVAGVDFFFWSFWCSKCWKTSPWQEANSIPYSRPYSLTGHNITAPPPPPPPPPPIQHMASRSDGKQRCRWWSAHCHLWPKCGTTPPVLAKVLLKVTGATLHPTNIHVKRYCEHKLIVTLGWCFSHKSHKSHKSLNFVVQ